MPLYASVLLFLVNWIAFAGFKKYIDSPFRLHPYPCMGLEWSKVGGLEHESSELSCSKIKWLQNFCVSVTSKVENFFLIIIHIKLIVCLYSHAFITMYCSLIDGNRCPAIKKSLKTTKQWSLLLLHLNLLFLYSESSDQSETSSAILSFW